jgi:acetate kinase
LNDISAKQYAAFDTSYFRKLPLEAKVYPLLYRYFEEDKIQRYGFHGISHQYATLEAAQELKAEIGELNLITIHLGAGCSMAAVEKGQPIDTSMGFTPLDGLTMMTRSGAIDPGIIFYLIKNLKVSAEKVEEILNKECGLLGISGVSDEMKDILFVAGIRVEDKSYKPAEGIKCDKNYIKRSKLALKIFERSVRKCIGAYYALLDKVDALVFTGEIGYGSSYLRKIITHGLNARIVVVRPNEELAIARQIIKKNN